MLISLKPPETGLALNLSPARSPAPDPAAEAASGIRCQARLGGNSEFRIPNSIRLSHVFPDKPNVSTLERSTYPSPRRSKNDVEAPVEGSLPTPLANDLYNSLSRLAIRVPLRTRCRNRFVVMSVGIVANLPSPLPYIIGSAAPRKASKSSS